MGVNLLLSAVGLVICFGGIYFKRLCAGMIGLIWGLVCAAVVVLMTVGIWNFDDHISTIIIIGLAMAFLSAIFDRLCVAVNGFLSSFTIVLLLLLLANDNDLSPILLLLSGLIALAVSIVSFKFYDYSFILLTAVTGAFIASVGLSGLINGYDIEDTLYRLLRRGIGGVPFVSVGTIGIGTCGFLVQLKRIKKRAIWHLNDVTKKDNGVIISSERIPSVGKAHMSQSFSDSISINKGAINAGESLSLSERIRKDIYLFFVPIISLVLMLILQYIVGKVYSDLSYYLYVFLSFTARSLVLGTFVYVCIVKDKSFSLAFSIVCAVLSTVEGLMLGGFSPWALLISLLEYPLLWMGLRLCMTLVQKRHSLTIILPGIAVLYSVVLIPFVQYFYFFINIVRIVIMLLFTYFVVYSLFKKKEGINIFKNNTDYGRQEHSVSTTRSRQSCDTEERRLNKPADMNSVCPYCGRSVNKNDSFCTNCGKRIER